MTPIAWDATMTEVGLLAGPICRGVRRVDPFDLETAVTTDALPRSEIWR